MRLMFVVKCVNSDALEFYLYFKSFLRMCNVNIVDCGNQ